MVRVGVLIVATNKYFELFPPLARSIRQHLRIPGAEVRLFCFTNVEAAVEADTTLVHVDHQPWPLVTLLRYKFFTDHADLLSTMDHLVYVDADMRFVAPVGSEILGDRVCVLHPGFHASPRADFTYETNPRSRAYVAPERGQHYFQNCFQAGRADLFLDMARELDEAIREDLRNNLIAVWWDESHMNRFMVDHPPTRILHPGYAYPEGWDLPFEAKVMGLAKDHEAMRSEPAAPAPAPAPAVLRVMEHSLALPAHDGPLQVLDLGFSLGEFLEGLLSAVGSARIGRYLAVEASPALCRAAAERWRSLPFFALRNQAVSHRDGQRVAFAEDAASPYNGTTLARARAAFDRFPGTRRDVEVPTVSLDTLLAELDHVDLLKIDIEGSELAALAAVSPDMIARVDQITCEFHDFLDPSLTPQVQATVARLQSLGFELHRAVATDYMHGSRFYDTHFLGHRLAGRRTA
jgi:histo-blood group ABO system transferase